MMRSSKMRCAVACALVAAGLFLTPAAASAAPTGGLFAWGRAVPAALAWFENLSCFWFGPTAAAKEGLLIDPNGATGQGETSATSDEGPLIDPIGSP